MAHERFLACISSNHEIAQNNIRKAARLASYYNSKWYVLYVQTPKESSDKIPLAAQRHLIIFQKCCRTWSRGSTEKGENIAHAIIKMSKKRKLQQSVLGNRILNCGR